LYLTDQYDLRDDECGILANGYDLLLMSDEELAEEQKAMDQAQKQERRKYLNPNKQLTGCDKASSRFNFYLTLISQDGTFSVKQTRLPSLQFGISSYSLYLYYLQ
jgi:hypothetical protein